MSANNIPGAVTFEAGSTYDIEKAFRSFKERTRRMLLAALAGRGPQTGADLMHSNAKRGYGKQRSHHLDSTLKHLKFMIQAGIVVEQPDPTDRRRTIYSLPPGVKVTKSSDEVIIDFGFCVLRLSPDGK